ncbi:hypothetical protein GGF31_006534 [Allomyces arbusculus]|nr:hypothetical protein GGF31_006534 [Allomyces arbusculus]
MKQPYHDPWARREAWRYHPIFSRSAQLRGAFPGLGIATAAFATYCVVEHFFFKKDDHHGHGHGHGAH